MIDVIDQFAASIGVRTCSSDTSDLSDGIDVRWEALRNAGIEHPGLAFASWVDLGLVGGVVPPLLANCRTVGTLLEALARFHPLWGDDQVIVDMNRSGWAMVTLRAPVGATVHPDTIDAFFAVLSRTLGQLTRPAIAMVRSGARLDQVELCPAELATPIALADPTISAVLSGYAETEVAQRDATWERRVRTELRADPGRAPNLTVVASRLAQSPRTLQQRLLEHGTSFALLLDDERRLHALGVLSNAGIPVSTAARRAGYRSVEGFSRAVRRWTGMSPSQWRVVNFG
jgi:AraC-like DNA-binding protein